MEINAQKRERTGKVNKSLRNEGLIPAVVFGKGLDSENISINKNEFIKLYKESGETSLIDIKIENDANHKVLVKEVAYNPVSDEIIHIGFYKPNLKEKTRVNIPIEVIGEEENELVKGGEAVVLTLMNEIEVEALPTDLPHVFEVDITNLTEVGQGITVADLKFDKSKVEIVDLEEDALILKLDHAQSLEVEEEEEVSEEEALAGIEATEEKDTEDTEDEEPKKDKKEEKEEPKKEE